MKTRMAEKGGPWVLAAWLFLLVVIALLWLVYYDWGGDDAAMNGEYEDEYVYYDQSKPYEPGDTPGSAGEPFSVSNGVITLLPGTGNIQIEKRGENDSAPVLVVEAFPEKHKKGVQ